ncbi:MAG: hypothetical protein AVDCRST_MAG64-2700 [uncultured Phycisphaerae bacterium]|uniref:DUF2281 domain-containing protein n=1 Tax=uncultured Phycisphaerae bacterium TaxID=904963 RepID=A0A6J4PLE9_9BACT|nr:MAG: hypothetical protein AVDCRST_MAG64-2700 [uncultured Phycisphaerae bacterium]
MHRLNELAAKLTPAQVKEVEDFAEFLVSKQSSTVPRASVAKREGETYLNVDAVAGVFAGLAPDKTDVELQHEAMEIRAAKYKE